MPLGLFSPGDELTAMLYYSLSNITVFIFLLIVLAAAYVDVKRFTLPNVFSLSMLILYPAFVLSSDTSVDWLSSVGVMISVLTVGFILFSLKYCGGGDSKLIAAISLWAGPDLVLDFLILTALAGGVIAFGYILYARFSFLYYQASVFAPFLPQVTTLDSKEILKKPIPYGTAIAIGGVYVAFTLLG